jgi:hypothetical protein
MQAATLPSASHKAGVTQTVKYSRFGANKKRGVHFQGWLREEGTLLAGPERGR